MPTNAAKHLLYPLNDFPDSVEQVADLGNGYLVVKIGLSVKEHVRPRLDVPTIPHRQLRRLFEELVGAGGAVPERNSPTQAKPEHAAEDNAALLDDMAAKAMQRRQRLHEEGQLLGSAQICDLLGITRQALSKAVKDQRMFWVDGPGGAQWYPGFYASSSANRKHIEQVCIALGDLPGDAKWQFFTTPKHSLGGKKPIETLEQGALDEVLRTAHAVRERSLGR